MRRPYHLLAACLSLFDAGSTEKKWCVYERKRFVGVFTRVSVAARRFVCCLRRISHAEQSVPQPADVPVDSVHDDVECVGALVARQCTRGFKSHCERDIVDATKVRAARRRCSVFRVERKRVAVDKCVRDTAVSLVRLYESVVVGRQLISAKAFLGVQLQASVLDRITVVRACKVEPIVAIGGTLSACVPDELQDRVVKVNGYRLPTTHQAVLRNALVLDDQLIRRHATESTALVGVQIDIGAQKVFPDGTFAERNLTTGTGANHTIAWFHRCEFGISDNQVSDGSPPELDRHGVELQRSEIERSARELSKPPRERHVKSPLFLRVDDELFASVAFSDHFKQAATDATTQLFVCEQEVSKDGIDVLRSN